MDAAALRLAAALGAIAVRVVGERDWRGPEARRLVGGLLEQRGR